MAEINRKYTTEECINVFNTFDLEFGLEAIRYLANKNTSIERLILTPDSNSMDLLLLAGTEDNNQKLASSHHKSWVVGHRFSISDFLSVAAYKLWSTWGFFQKESETGVLADLAKRMDNHVIMEHMKIRNQETEIKMLMYTKNLLEQKTTM